MHSYDRVLNVQFVKNLKNNSNLFETNKLCYSENDTLY